MRGSGRARIVEGRIRSGWLLLAAFLVACGSPEPRVAVPGSAGSKTSAVVRADRRAYDGAPPVIAHEDFGMDCNSCHNEAGMEVEGIGFAPPSPHEATTGMSAISRCRQCHVFQATAELFVANEFQGLTQDLRHGRRLNPLAPPTIPHKTFMRENCLACHSGPAAREPIRTDHPERVRCRQCHVPVETGRLFASPAGP